MLRDLTATVLSSTREEPPWKTTWLTASRFLPATLTSDPPWMRLSGVQPFAHVTPVTVGCGV